MPNLAQYIDVVRDVLGRAVPQCTIAVLEGLPDDVDTTTQPGSPLAGIFTDPDGADPLDNPFQTDGAGNYQFYAASGNYTIQIYGSGIRDQFLLQLTLPEAAGSIAADAVLLNPTSAQVITGGNHTLKTNNSGVFTNTQMHEYLQSLVGGISEDEFHQVGYNGYATEGVQGGVAVPVGATIINANGVAGYVTNAADSSSGTMANAVAVFGSARATGNNAAVWGGNFVANSPTGIEDTFVVGGEFDVGVGGTPAFVLGVGIFASPSNGITGTMPTNSIGLQLGASSESLKWFAGIVIDQGAVSGNAIQIGAVSRTGTSHASLPIAFNHIDSDGTSRTDVKMFCTEAGSLQIGTTALGVNSDVIARISGVSDTTGLVNTMMTSGVSGRSVFLQFTDNSTYNACIGGNGATGDLVVAFGKFANSAGTERARITQSAGNLELTTGVLDTKTGGSTTISTGVGSVKMSTANPATNTVWIPMKYNGTSYFVPGFTTNAP